MGTLSRRERDPEKETRLLKRRFSKITRGFERAQSLRRLYRASVFPVLLIVIIGGFGAAILLRSPWPPLATVRHAVAFAGCSAANWVGLAPAVKGNPGYWRRLDRNGTGWSCMPGAS
jgi:hypothetical protein